MTWTKWIAALGVAWALGAPASAQLGQDMTEFWEDLNGYGNVSGPSSHDLQSGGYYTLGQIYLRTPRKTFDPIDIQFPSYRAGCGGIDLFAGGFSFIDADEFIDFLKAVAADSAGLIFKAGIDAVSPELGGILADLEERANTINSWNMDSCEKSMTAPKANLTISAGSQVSPRAPMKTARMPVRNAAWMLTSRASLMARARPSHARMKRTPIGSGWR